MVVLTRLGHMSWACNPIIHITAWECIFYTQAVNGGNEPNTFLTFDACVNNGNAAQMTNLTKYVLQCTTHAVLYTIQARHMACMPVCINVPCMQLYTISPCTSTLKNAKFNKPYKLQTKTSTLRKLITDSTQWSMPAINVPYSSMLSFKCCADSGGLGPCRGFMDLSSYLNRIPAVYNLLYMGAAPGVHDNTYL